MGEPGMHIGRHIRARRRELELSQESLGREVGVTSQNISSIESEHSEPSLELLVRLHQALGVSTDYLLTGQESAPVSIAGVIRSHPDLTPSAKRSLIQIITELSGTDP